MSRPRGPVRYLSQVSPHWVVRALGLVTCLALLGVVASLVLNPNGVPFAVLALIGVLALLGAAAGLCLALVKVTLEVTEWQVHVAYPPFTRVLNAEFITGARPGDRDDGVGFGYGIRWEGRGKIALRVGGPAVLIEHSRPPGSTVVSVDDPERAVAAIRQAVESAARP